MTIVLVKGVMLKYCYPRTGGWDKDNTRLLRRVMRAKNNVLGTSEASAETGEAAKRAEPII